MHRLGMGDDCMEIFEFEGFRCTALFCFHDERL
jgi:hypothetical protein